METLYQLDQERGITSDPPFELAPGKQATVPVQYVAESSEEASAHLVLYTNDPLASQGTAVELVANGGTPAAPSVSIEAPAGASGDVTCKLEGETPAGDLLTYTWNWQVRDGEPFTTFSPVLGADAVRDCDRVRCWAIVSNGAAEASSNVAETILPFGSDCDDANLCTDDSCGQQGGCLQTNNSTSCADDDLCNGSEVCVDGQCQASTPVECSGLFDPCKERICNPLTGACDLAMPDGTLCPDDDLCNGLEFCESGSCVAGTPTDCSDVAEPCVEKLCNPDSGLCDLAKPEGTPCADGDLCNGVERCTNGACVEGTATVCSGLTDPCIQEVCNPSTGLCDLPMPDTTSCADSDLCNGSESCLDGHCVAGTPTDCTAVTSSCLQKVCNPLTGECNLPEANHTPCDDANLCNGRETCQDGACVSGLPIDCGALGERCRGCDASTGTCTVTFQDGSTCDDGDSCTSNDVCVGGTCAGDEACDICGDGELSPDEECDDGNSNDTDGCSNSCTLNATCTSLHLDGQDDYAEAPSFQDYAWGSTLTAEAWVNWSANGDHRYEDILRSGTETNTAFQISIAGQVDPNPNCFGVSEVGRVAVIFGSACLLSPAPISSQEWHHIAVTYGASRITLFIDGVEEATSPAPATLPSSPTPLSIGRNYHNAFRFGGWIDEVRISDSVRYIDTFTPPVYNSPDADTIALWHMDEGTGATVADESGHGYILNIAGASWAKQSFNCDFE